MNTRIWGIVGALVLFSASAYGHVGNPDVYAEGEAGPYKLFVVVRPPLVIPGVADIEVRAETNGVNAIEITPIPLTGEAASHPPVPDAMKQPTSDKQFFTGHLWIMATGSWQIRFAVTGASGTGTLSVPVPAIAKTTRRMTGGLGGLLAALGILLVAGLVGIVGAAAREAKLPPGAAIPPGNRRSARIAMMVASALLLTALVLGNTWWNSEASAYAGLVYRPLEMQASLRSGNVLDLALRDPGWLEQRRLDDFIPDHDHLMHLYMIRWPAMDVVFHLHPLPVGTAKFELSLPSLPAGTYRLYADVVHRNGFPETVFAAIDLPALTGRALGGDDAEGSAAALHPSDEGEGKSSSTPDSSAQTFRLSDGYTMVWRRPDALRARSPLDVEFELLDPQGKPPSDMALYMGMLGHAAFVNTNGSTFAHVHPTGTVSMAAFMMANPARPGTDAGGRSMPGMEMGGSPLPNVVDFPYGFPVPGNYRIFVQMKHGSTIETGIFDAVVVAPAS